MLLFNPINPLLVTQYVLAQVALRADDHDVAKGMFTAQCEGDHMVGLFAQQPYIAVRAMRRKSLQLCDCRS
jgi:hypothetical protein